jgi:serine-type D-Ala-D-Ala carboxypeptidase/endopeptidase
MKKSLFVITFLISSFFAFAYNGNTQLKKKIDALAAQYLANPENAGISIGIIKNGIYADYSYGVRNKYSREPVDGNTIFEIGSITKIFTSIILAEEVKKGKLNLNRPITDFFPNQLINERLKGINLMHLATHSSGLPRLADNFWPSVTDKDNPYISYTTSHMLTYLNKSKPSTVGARYDYSNFGFGLLGYILSSNNNCTYDNLVQQNVCEPFGMANTSMAIKPEAGQNTASGHSKGRIVKNWDFLDATAGQGALRSNTSDMLKFMRYNLNPSEVGLSEEIKLTQQLHFRDYYSGIQTGLGWHIGTFYGEKYLEHTGGTGGFRSFIGICPETGMGVVILSNSDNDVANIGLEILKYLRNKNV